MVIIKEERGVMAGRVRVGWLNKERTHYAIKRKVWGPAGDTGRGGDNGMTDDAVCQRVEVMKKWRC